MLKNIANIARFIAGHPLTRDQRLRAFARFIKWQFISRLYDEVTVPWIGSTKLAVRRGMAGATGNIYVGLHEFPDMAFLLHFLRGGDLFVDIGANVGTYTVLASGVCGARSISFEPDPDSFARLCRNIALNDLDMLVTARNEAAGAACGEVEFTVGLDTVNRVAAGSAGPTRIVAMSTLDDVVGNDAPIMIKMDVEGHEFDVLQGAAKTLGNQTLRVIISENRSEPIVSMLHRAGFREASYDAFARTLREPGGEQSGNALFVRDSAFVEARVIGAAPIYVLGRTI